MKQTVYKYPLGFVEDESTDVEDVIAAVVVMPKDAQVLTLRVQHGTPTVWARVLTNLTYAQPDVERRFRLFGTGWEIPVGHNYKYIGTFDQLDGNLIWHVFEEDPPTSVWEERYGDDL